MTIRELYLKTKAKLASNGLTSKNECNVLFEAALGADYRGLDHSGVVSEDKIRKLKAVIAKRMSGFPLQYIAGTWPFLDFELSVGPGVLIPRPETELLAQLAARMAGENESPEVIDLCSGTGCVAIAIRRAVPNAKVTALELTPEAFEYLEKNTRALAEDISCVRGDVFGFEKTQQPETVDLIVSNPPYVTPKELKKNFSELRFEPKAAFIGGEDGLDFYKHIIPAYKDALKPGGTMIFEIGAKQKEAVEALFSENGFDSIVSIKDDGGLYRVVSAKKVVI